MKTGKKVLILDGDSIAYRCAAACEERYIQVLHKPSGKEKIFKNRTEFQKHMKDAGKTITSRYEVFDCQESGDLSVVLRTIRQHIKRLKDFSGAHKVIIYAGEEGNFRNELELPSQYKGNRKDTLRPIHLEAAKEYLRTSHKAKKAFGYEVDDACCIAAYDELRNGNIPVMYLYDKDQKSFEDVVLISEGSDGELTETTVPLIGELTYEKTTVKGYGLKFLAYQWICSDLTDNYKAYEVSKVPFGPKKAFDYLKDLDSEHVIFDAIIAKFKEFYPEPVMYTSCKGTEVTKDWKDMMQMYYKCCRMKRSEDDPLDCFKFFKERGWNG